MYQIYSLVSRMVLKKVQKEILPPEHNFFLNYEFLNTSRL